MEPADRPPAAINRADINLIQTDAIHMIELVIALLPAWLRRLLFWLIYVPAAILYFSGPQVWGIGFWQGRSIEQICQEITQSGAVVNPSFWSANPLNHAVCEALVLARFHAFLVLILVLAYFASLLFLVWLLYRLICRLLQHN